MTKTARNYNAFLLTVLVAGTCHCDGDDVDEAPDTGPAVTGLTLTLSNVPSTARCARIILGGEDTVFVHLNLSGASGGPVTRTLERSPGKVVVSAQVYEAACPEPSDGGTSDGPDASASGPDAAVATADAGVASTTVLSAGGPRAVTVSAGSAVAVALELVALRPHQMPTPLFEVPSCDMAGTTCGSHDDCCSGVCVAWPPPGLRDPPGTPRPKKCQALEPGGAVRARLTPAPSNDFTEKYGGRVSYPSFDGDAFFVTYTRQPAAPGASGLATVKTRVDEALQAIGAISMLMPPPELNSPAGPRSLAPGNYEDLVKHLCDEGDTEAASRQICNDLRLMAPMTMLTPLTFQRLGMPQAQLIAEIQRPIHYWVYHQRVRDIPIEHKSVVVLQRDGQTVSTVFGAFLKDYRIMNEVALNDATAAQRGREVLGD